MRSKGNRFALKQNYPFPLKDKGAIVIMPSGNSLWDYEAYDYAGVFVGYMSPTENNPLHNTSTIKQSVGKTECVN